MIRLARSPPVVGLSLAFGAGVALTHLGASLAWAPLPLLILTRLNGSSSRPGALSAAVGTAVPLALGVLSGCVVARAWNAGIAADCRFILADGDSLHVSGWIAGIRNDGRGELQPEPAGTYACSRRLRVLVPWNTEDGRDGSRIGPGAHVSLQGVWRASPLRGTRDPLFSGYLRVDSLAFTPGPGPAGLKAASTRLAGAVEERLTTLLPGTGSVAAALVWARREAVPPAVREAFARAGTAHLMAISGFHVGVVGGVLLTILGVLGLPPSPRQVLAGLGVWAYVLAIGLPDAAVRAAVLLTLLLLGRLTGRALVPSGALATAFLGFLVLDPGALARPGFQLSFAGAAGLTYGYEPVRHWIQRSGRGRIPVAAANGAAAGVAATLATLPIVAWHFGRVSLLGIPMTLVSAPLLVLAIPGLFLILLLSSPLPAVAGFLALGVDWILATLLSLTQGAASLPFASVWVPEPMIVAGLGALGVCGFLAWWLPGAGRVSMGPVVAGAVLTGIVLAMPVVGLASRGTLEVIVLDVGQGDATLIRSPAGRWILVDAGPRTASFDAGESTVVPFLRRRGVGALAFMVLTHPDMDHVGGAAAVLEVVPTGAVLDPGVAAGTDAFLDVLRAAHAKDVPWRIVEAGDSIDLDGMALRVLAPEPGSPEDPREDNNDASVVLEVRFGDFSALLTGDAPSAAELRFAPSILSSRVSVLKVGHHGSATSTSGTLLERALPEVALISVGQRNRFGHPDPEVLERLESAGVEVFRTDEGGDIRVRARADGSYRVSVEIRPP